MRELPNPRPSQIAQLECVAYQKYNLIDTHAAYDAGTGNLTIVKTGKYAVKIGPVIKIQSLDAGHVLKNPDIVVSEQCGMFYESAAKSGVK